MEIYRILKETSETLSQKVADTLVLPKDKYADRIIRVDCVLTDPRLARVSEYLISVTKIDLVGLEGNPKIEIDAHRVDNQSVTEAKIGQLILQDPPILVIFDDSDEKPIGDLSEVGQFDIP